jgi:extracellular factor (EF) 3-hydroxypalmitic acid methyl ester biosynthesis protein
MLNTTEAISRPSFARWKDTDLSARWKDTVLDETYAMMSSIVDVSVRNQQVVDQAMTRLAETLRQLRLGCSTSQWQACAQSCLQHPLRALLHQDPFTHRAFIKPRGYAGDAVMLDYVYGREEGWDVPEKTTPLGQMIFDYTTRAPASEGSRARRRFVADEIDRLAADKRQPDILSIACGHLREANLSAAIQYRQVGRFLALDSDISSLEEVTRCYGQWGVEILPASIRHLLTNRLELGRFDLVYSTGLFDYLQQPTAQRLVENMFRMVRSGGRVLIANVLPEIRDVGYMESYMDWKLVSRTRCDMVQLTANIPESELREVRVFAEENVNIVFLELNRK